MKKHVQIKNSYSVWKRRTMWCLILEALGKTLSAKFKHCAAIEIEWWLHNIGYWLTRPFIFIPALKAINLRCKDVDLMVEVEDDE